MESRATRILSVSHDQLLLATRELVLQAGGYAVQSTTSTREALDRIQAGNFDLLLIGHTISDSERREMIALLRAQAPSVPVVFVSSLDNTAPEVLADVNTSSSPHELLESLRKLSIQSGISS